MIARPRGKGQGGPPKRWGSAGQGPGEEPQEGHEQTGWLAEGWRIRSAGASEVARSAPGAWGPPPRILRKCLSVREYICKAREHMLVLFVLRYKWC